VIVYRHPGLSGLEIWHGLAGVATLDQLRHDKAAYFAALSGFLDRLHAGTAATADGDNLSAAIGFEQLLLAGGDAAEASVYATRPHRIAAAGPFAARAGAEAVWAELGWQNPVAIDLGQTRMKVITATSSTCLERDEAWLPFGRDALPPETGRARLQEWVRQALPPNPGGVLLGLPTAINPNGVAEAATYPGLFGSLEPIFADLFPGIPWAVCNDAVLTARGFPPANRQKTLLLTLGFGIGAAIWE